LKFCKRCGLLDKVSNLRLRHFRTCQPELEDGESGFLRNGKLPDIREEEFRMVLSVIGSSVKAPFSDPAGRESACWYSELSMIARSKTRRAPSEEEGDEESSADGVDSLMEPQTSTPSPSPSSAPTCGLLCGE